MSARSGLTGPDDAGARLGDELVATASGPDARGDRRSRSSPAAASAKGSWRPAPSGRPSRPRRRRGRARGRRRAGPGAVLAGIASPGVAAAPARHLGAEPAAPPEREPRSPSPSAGGSDGAGSRRAAIEADRERVARGAVAEAEIFSAHLALLDDEALLQPALAAIDAGASAEGAWLEAAAEVADTYRGLDAPLLRERAADVTDVGRRVAAAVTGEGWRLRPARGGHRRRGRGSRRPRPPALDPALVRGIATARGTPTAHAAILARALGGAGGGRPRRAPARRSRGSRAAPRRRRGIGPGLAPDDVLEAAEERAARASERRAAARARPRARADAVAPVEVAANVDTPPRPRRPSSWARRVWASCEPSSCSSTD